MEIINTTSDFIGVQGIYAIVNKLKPTSLCKYGKPYVGQAYANPDAKKHKMGIGARLRTHRYFLRKGFHGNKKLQNAWSKYGENNFLYLLIEVVGNSDSLTEREQHWMDEWDVCKYGYNVRPIADSTRGLFLKPLLSDEILAKWINEFYKKYGKFPSNNSGMIENAGEDITWRAINECLERGFRNLAGNRTLSKFIADKFGVVNLTNSKKYTEEQIIKWIRRYFDEHKVYPNNASGVVEYTKEDGYSKVTWDGLSSCMVHGQKGMLGGYSLSDLIKKLNGYSVSKIKDWITRYFIEKGNYPTKRSGIVEYSLDDGYPKVTWVSIDGYLRKGMKGLIGNSSLSKLIKEIND